MPGFWTKTPEGHTIHINGDPAMSEETRFALSVMMDKLTKEFVACHHSHFDVIHTSHHGPHYTFVVERCEACEEVTVRVWGMTDETPMYLATLPTRIAHYATNQPAAGYAYYWRFDGLSHSTPPIAPHHALCECDRCLKDWGY